MKFQVDGFSNDPGEPFITTNPNIDMMEARRATVTLRWCGETARFAGQAARFSPDACLQIIQGTADGGQETAHSYLDAASLRRLSVLAAFMADVLDAAEAANG